MKIEKERMSAVLHDLELERKALRISTPKFSNAPEDKRFPTDEPFSHHNIDLDQLQAHTLREEMASLENNFALERKEYVSKIEYLQKIIKYYDERQRETIVC